MERMTVEEATRDFPALVHRVCEERVTIDIEQDHEAIIRLTPIRTKRPVMACDLNELFASLPSLGDDAEVFARDIADAQAQLQSAQRPLPSSGMSMMEFGKFLALLPSLGDDSEAFERDIEEMRNFYLPEVDPWQS